jgi:hypothetical protein
MGSEVPHGQKHDLPEITKWRHIDEASTQRDQVIVIIPEVKECASEFFDELKPVMYTMKIFGLFPLQKRNAG